MVRYIALLRGINVGGHNVKMEHLRSIFEDLGFGNVRSYINSGNIFFETNRTDRRLLTDDIEKQLYDSLQYEVPTFIRTIEEVESIVKLDPFNSVELTSDRRFCVVFTKQPIQSDISLPQHSSKNDMDLILANPYEAFVVWHIINGRPPSGKFSEDIIPAENTTRFFHTLSKILTAARAK